MVGVVVEKRSACQEEGEVKKLDRAALLWSACLLVRPRALALQPRLSVLHP